MMQQNIEKDGSEPEYHTDLPVGEILRRTRVHYGLSIADVEKALRIRESLILAIETNDTEQLPGRVYAIGFVRSYAEYLGFDGDRVVQLFKNQSLNNAASPDLHFPVAVTETQMPSMRLIAISLAAVVILLVIWSFWGARDQNVRQINEIPAVEDVFQTSDVAAAQNAAQGQPQSIKGPFIDSEKNLPEDAMSGESPLSADSLDTPSPIPEAPAQDTQQGILLNVIENSWVEIRDADNTPIVSRVLKAGERYYIPSRPDLSMSIGNAGGLQILVDGEQIPALGERGEIRRNIILDSETLKSLASPQAAQ